jgi:hypothetical protein
MSDLSSAITTPDIATSDRDPSACRPPALDLQSTDTAAAAPAPSLRSSWRHVTHVRSPKIRHIECNEPARNLLPGAWSGFLSDRSLAKDRAGTAGSRLPTERGQDKSRTLRPGRTREKRGNISTLAQCGGFDPRCAISEKPSKINIDPHIARRRTLPKTRLRAAVQGARHHDRLARRSGHSAADLETGKRGNETTG